LFVVTTPVCPGGNSVNIVALRGPERGASGASVIPPAESAGHPMAPLSNTPTSQLHRKKTPETREAVGQWLFAAADMEDIHRAHPQKGSQGHLGCGAQADFACAETFRAIEFRFCTTASSQRP
jgi:hypothetical protein